MSNFSDLLKARGKMNQTTEGNKAEIKNAVFQLVSYHQDMKVILSEAGSIGVTTTENTDSKGSKVFSPEVFQHCIRGSLGNSSMLHTAETCASQILEVVQKLTEESDENETLMETVNKQIRMVKQLMKGQYFNRPRFLNILCNEPCLPIPVLHVLHEETVMTLDSYIRFKNTDSKLISGFSEQLFLSRRYSNSLNGILSMLINYSFPEKPDTDHTIKKICTSILIQTLHRNLNSIQDGGTISDISLVPSGHVICSEVSLKKYCSFLLHQIFVYQPHLNVIESFQQQTNWKFAKLPSQLTELFKQILIILDTADVMEMVKQTLETQEVNWFFYNAFWSTFLICTELSRTITEDFLMGLLRAGFEESCTDIIVKGFLIGRQCCQEGTHVFQSYQDWFQNLFGDSTRSLTNTKKSFSCLIKVLTELVPYDQPSCLKVHILRPPFVPPKCRELLSDYIILAKTRLADLKEPLEQVGMYEGMSGASSTKEYTADYTFTELVQFQNQLEEDVQKALAAFESNKKIPSAVMEASIFRKSYFIGKFLQVLLKPRPLPDIPDLRMKFIEALKKVEKIPPNMHKAYEIGCKKEAENLLQGVFMEIDDEDDDVEMTMSAMEQFDHRLSLMMNKITQNQSSKQYPEMVSILKEKINTLLNNHDQLNTADCLISIDMSNPELKSVHIKIVDGVMNLFCKVSENCLSEDKPDLSWASQFVDMLGEFRILHKALFVRIIKLLTCQGNSLENHHITGLALLLTFLSIKSVNFGLVEISPCINSCCQGQQYFSERVWNLLPMYSAEQMVLCLKLMSLYLFCVFSVVDSSCLLMEDYNKIYPQILLKKFIFLFRRLIPESSCDDIPIDFTTAVYIYRSDQFKEILNSIQLTFENWVRMELDICPDTDILSHFERQEYLYNSLYKHYLTIDKQDGGCYHDYRYICSTIIQTIIQADMRSCDKAVYCPLCLQNRKQTNNRIFLIQYLQELCWSLPRQQQSHDNQPMIISVLKLLTRNSSDPLSTETIVKSFFRVITCLPRHLFYTDNMRNPYIDIDLVISFINEELKESLGCGCVFERNVFFYLIEGIIHIQDTIDTDKVLMNCPMLTSSLIVYLPDSRSLVEQLYIKNSDVINTINWVNRSLDGNISEFYNGPRWMYSIALLSLNIHRNSIEDIITAVKLQKKQHIDLIVSEFVMVYTAYMTYKKEAPYNNVLDKLQLYFPRMLLCLPDHLHNICTKSTLAVIPFNLLRYMSRTSDVQNHLISDPAYIHTVLNLYSQVISQHKNHKSSLSSELEISKFVQTCVTRVPDFVLKIIDHEILTRCGMDVVLTVQERLKSSAIN